MTREVDQCGDDPAMKRFLARCARQFIAEGE